MRRHMPLPARFLEVPKEDCDIALLYVGGHQTFLPTWKGQFVIIWHDGRYYIDPDEIHERKWKEAYGKEWQASLKVQNSP